MVTILAAVAGLMLTSAWFGFASIGPYIRAGRELPDARRRAADLQQQYESAFGSRGDARTFLALIGAKPTRFDARSSGGGLFIPVSTRRDLFDQQYVESVESFVVGNFTRPIVRRVAASIAKRTGLWFDHLKAVWREENSKSEDQLNLERELRDAYAKYNWLKSERRTRGVLMVTGAAACLAILWIAIEVFQHI